MFETIASAVDEGAWVLVERLAAADGTAAQPWFRALLAPGARHRDLADAVHALCALHGRHPGMADEAHPHCLHETGAAWLAAVSQGFAAERTALATLVAAAGPLPSTPGQADSQAAVLSQRRALEMLARSDRVGCGGGAISGLLIDWAAIRELLGRAADCFGVTIAPSRLPGEAASRATLAALNTSPGASRATAFGAQQLFAQHRGLWSLLEARAHARERS